MSWWQGLFLGVVQGLTEFLPISSSGHLVVAEAALGLSTPGVLVEVVLHVATLLAVIVVFWKALWDLARGVFHGDRGAWRYLGLLAIGTVPAGVVGFFLQDFFEGAFDSLLLVGVNFLVTGLVLWSTRSRIGAATRESPGVRGAVGIGIAQAFAILPGISRSGTTVTAALWWGVDPVRAAEFSFLLAIPAVAGAALLQVGAIGGAAASVGGGSLVLAFGAALVSGVMAIRILIALLRRGVFHRFAPYCWAIGTLTILWALRGS